MTNIAVEEQTAEPKSLPLRDKTPTVATNSWPSKPDTEKIRRVLDALCRWHPLDWDVVFDDLDMVLHGAEVSHHAAGSASEVPLVEYDNAEELAERFRQALTQLVNRGLRDDAHNRHPDISDLIRRAHALIPEELPGDPSLTCGHLRKLGGVVLELAECLEETGIVKGLVEC